MVAEKKYATICNHSVHLFEEKTIFGALFTKRVSSYLTKRIEINYEKNIYENVGCVLLSNGQSVFVVGIYSVWVRGFSRCAIAAIFQTEL